VFAHDAMCVRVRDECGVVWRDEGELHCVCACACVCMCVDVCAGMASVLRGDELLTNSSGNEHGAGCMHACTDGGWRHRVPSSHVESESSRVTQNSNSLLVCATGIVCDWWWRTREYERLERPDGVLEPFAATAAMCR
jgi:hypothetical protein